MRNRCNIVIIFEKRSTICQRNKLLQQMLTISAFDREDTIFWNYDGNNSRIDYYNNKKHSLNISNHRLQKKRILL